MSRHFGLEKQGQIGRIDLARAKINCRTAFNSRVLLFLFGLMLIVTTLYLLVSTRFQFGPASEIASPMVRALAAISMLTFVSLATRFLYLPNYLKGYLSGAPFGSAWDLLDDAIGKYFKLLNITIVFTAIALLTINISWMGYASLYAACFTAILAMLICLDVIVKLIQMKRRLTAAPALFFRR